MDFGSHNAREDGEHNNVEFVEISKISVTRMHFSLEKIYLTKFTVPPQDMMITWEILGFITRRDGRLSHNIRPQDIISTEELTGRDSSNKGTINVTRTHDCRIKLQWLIKWNTRRLKAIWIPYTNKTWARYCSPKSTAMDSCFYITNSTFTSN